MNRRLIHRTSLSKSLPVGFEGGDVLSWHAALLEGLEGVPGLAGFLAYPVKARADDHIDWYTPLDGEVLALGRLPPSRQARAAKQAEELLELVRRTAARLKGSDRYRNRQTGEAMLAAVSHPEAMAFFLVGDTPVCAGWGLAKGVSLPFEVPEEPLPPEPEYLPPPEPEYQPPPEPEWTPPPPPPPKRPLGERLRPFLKGVAAALALTLVIAFCASPSIRRAAAALFQEPWDTGLDTRHAVLEGLREDLDSLRQKYFVMRGICLVVPQGPAPQEGPVYLQGCYVSRQGVFFDAASGQPQTLSFCVTGPSGKAELRISPASGQGEPCRAEALASAEASRLTVTAQQGPACGEDAYPPMRVACEAGRPDGTQAECFLEEQNAQGGYYEPVPVEFRQSW
ncbi:MAG: hypothetical protein LBW85_09580 [Deltaproteobacteria bacterium]|nr:hypothetical protein [Deltaproteobacteria bacterium]